jgi:Pyruvate/2-oxoacid:ferredoxin oxidoreductase delta subunit
MCEFCTQHGEGEKWYLQAKNYSQELLNDERKRFATDFMENIEQRVGDRIGALSKLMASDPAAARRMFPAVVEQQKKEHMGQVVPLEEIEQILDMSLSVVRLPCVCRGTLRGFREARYCFGVTPSQSDFDSVAENPDFSSDLEVLSREEAKKAIQKLDRNGLVHTVWTFITPYIGGICNCTVNECLALKTRTRLDLPILFKAEHVATIDWEECNGCRDCMKLCNFGAIGHSAYANKCSINQLQCYGCGVCRALCPNDAITLLDRNAIPALANEW